MRTQNEQQIYARIIETEGFTKMANTCYTKGFLTYNAKNFCELASSAGGNIAILTDLDMSGLLIAGKVPDIPRIGITLDTIQALRIPISEIAEDLSERVNKHVDAVRKLYLSGTIDEKDWELS